MLSSLHVGLRVFGLFEARSGEFDAEDNTSILVPLTSVTEGRGFDSCDSSLNLIQLGRSAGPKCYRCMFLYIFNSALQRVSRYPYVRF
jgi:hypothetical protein